MGIIKFGTFLALVSTFYSLAGWPGAIISAALCLLGLWWVER
tara:strand:+ start:418 stop:543 length:126 start_codon:yes stop_codon:yes gene_type:complete